jgi:hypothetical protein
MNLEGIKQELIEQGKSPDDFNIQIAEEGFLVTPKWFYEIKQIAKLLDKPTKDDIDITAETLVLTMMDVEDLAEMIVYALNKIDELEAKING